jgi:hypothetical protein
MLGATGVLLRMEKYGAGAGAFFGPNGLLHEERTFTAALLW